MALWLGQPSIQGGNDSTSLGRSPESSELVPAPLLGVYQLPTYPAASIPNEAQFNDALQWALDKGLLTSTAPYADTVDDSYLP